MKKRKKRLTIRQVEKFLKEAADKIVLMDAKERMKIVFARIEAEEKASQENDKDNI